MKQFSLAERGFARTSKMTRKQVFLDEMERVRSPTVGTRRMARNPAPSAEHGNGLFFHIEMQEAGEQDEQAVALQHLFPQAGCLVVASFGIGRAPSMPRLNGRPSRDAAASATISS